MTLPFPIQFASNGPQWAQGFDAWYDYTKPQGSQLLAFPPATDTHSATVYAQSSSGVWQAIPANVPSRTDLGLQTVPTRVQLINNTTTISTSFFINTGCTAFENATGPDGSTNGATTITSSGVGDNRRQRNFVIANDNTRYTFQVFVAKTSSAPTYYPSVNLILTGGTQVTAHAVVNPFTGTIESAGAAGFTATVRPSGAFWIVSVSVSNNTTGNVTMALQLYPSWNTDGSITQNLNANGATVFAWPTAVPGDFTYPIPNATGGSVTVNGNQQVVDLTGRLGSGVGGIVQFNGLSALVAGDFGRIITFTDGGADDNNAFRIYRDGATRYLAELWTGAVKQAGIPITGGAISGLQTLAFAYAENYVNARFVGQSASSADTSASLPTLTKMNIGSNGINGASGNYQLTRRLALKFGAQDASTFADLFAKATLLAAVS